MPEDNNSTGSSSEQTPVTPTPATPSPTPPPPTVNTNRITDWKGSTHIPPVQNPLKDNE